MAISFSGLASGLDTSSWVESLVALKQAKIDTLEEQKETVLLSRETLNNIKSFFNSFRSVIEKVTDAKYGVASMDIFAQKLATSSDLNILTASAATEAEEAEYNILVDNLATSTEAVSGLKVLNTIIETSTAVGNTKLVDLGIKVGEIGIDNNGIYNIIQIEKNDTIESFIAKLHNIGVDATYNSKTGIFGINLDDGSIDDTLTIHDDGSVGTGILDIFNLHEKGGYESTYLQTSTSETIVNAATSSTKLSELGSIKAGNIQVKANGTSYNLSIDGNTTLGGLVSSLNSLGVDAKLASNGVLTINDAEIVDSGNTGIITALGLETDINSKTQTASGLKTVVVTTTDAAATGATKLSELGSIKAGNIQVKANGALYTIAISGSTTLQGLIDALSAKGVDASLSSDGVFTVKNAEIIDSGNTGLISALGLQVDVNSKTQSSIDLRTVVTTTTQAAATGATKLSQLGSITNGNMLVKANNTTYTIAINTSTTLQGLIDGLKAKGISAELSGDGTLTIKDAEIIDNNTGIINALGLEKEVSSKTQTANNLSYKSVITTSSEATSSTKLGDLSVWSKISTSPVLTAKNTSGGTTSITLTSTMTIGDVVTKLNSAGLSAAFSSSGVLAVTGGEVSGNAAEALGIKSGSENTSGVWANGNTLFTQGVNYAVASNTLGELGISTAKPSSGYALAVYNSSNALVKEISVSSSTRIDDIFSALSQYGITGTIDEGKITLKSSNGNYVKGSVADAMGISTITSVIVSSTNASSTSSIKYTVTQVVSGTTTFAQAGLNAAGKVLEIKTKENGVTQAYITIASNSTTFDSMFSSLSKYGFSAAINDGVITLSSSQYIVGGSMAELLGIETYATSDAYTVGEAITSTGALTYTDTIIATASALIKDYISLDSNAANNRIRIYYNNDTAYKDFTVTTSTTFQNLIDVLKANFISAELKNGVLTIAGANYGAHAEDIPASGGILSKLGMSKYKVNEHTVGVSQTSSSAISVITKTYKTITYNTTLAELFGGNSQTQYWVTIMEEETYCNGHTAPQTAFRAVNAICIYGHSTLQEVSSQLRQYGNLNFQSNGVGFQGLMTIGRYYDYNAGANVSYIESQYYLTGDLADKFGWSNKSVQTLISATTASQSYTGNTVQAYLINGWSNESDKAITYNITGSSSYATMDANTTFVQLGLHSGVQSDTVIYTFRIRGTDGNVNSSYFSVNTSTTVNDLLSFLRNRGLTANVSNGKLSISSDGETYITFVNEYYIWDRLGLNRTASAAQDGNTYYGTFTKGITTIRRATTLGEIGLGEQYIYVKPCSSSSTSSYSLGIKDTVASLVAKLNGSLSNGKVTINGISYVGTQYDNSNATGDQEGLVLSVLGGLKIGEGYTYKIDGQTATLRSSSTSYTKLGESSSTQSLSTSSKLVDLGFVAGQNYNLLSYVNTTVSGGVATQYHHMLTFSVNATSTVANIISAINNVGLSASVSGGKLTINGKTGTTNNVPTVSYVMQYNDTFKNAFKLSGGGLNSTYSVKDLYQNSNSNKQERLGPVYNTSVRGTITVTINGTANSFIYTVK